MLAAAHQEVQVVAGDRELRGFRGAQGPVAVVEGVDQARTGKAAHRVLSGQRSGGRSISERAVLPVSGFVGHGPAVVGAVVEAGERGSGGQGIAGFGGLGREGGAVEVANKVLPGRSARDAAGVDVDHHDPLDVGRVAVNGQREEVRALPEPARGVGRSELAQERPVLEVPGFVQQDLVVRGLDGGHHPVAAAIRGAVPKDLGVAEVCRVPVQHRVGVVLRPGLAVVQAVGQRLRLQALVRESPACRRWCRWQSAAGFPRFRTRRCCPCPPPRCRRRCPAGHRWRWPTAAPSSASGPWTWHAPRTCFPTCFLRGCAGNTGGRRPCGRPSRWDRSSSSASASSGRPAGTAPRRGAFRNRRRPRKQFVPLAPGFPGKPALPCPRQGLIRRVLR